MRERERFGEYVNLIVSTFKEDIKQGLVHVTDLMHLSKIPFQHASKNKNEAGTNKGNASVAQSSGKI